MTEALSATTFMIGARLPWAAGSVAPAETGPLDSAAVHHAGSRKACAIRKISSVGATLSGDVAGAPGDALTVELETGQRPAATIDWIEAGEIGISFKSAIDVIALINRKLVSQAADRRAMPRVELRCAAWIKKGQDFGPAFIRNISAAGLQLEGDDLPAVGSYVSLFVEGLNVPSGEVIWRKDGLAGIQLLEELSWSSIMPWIRELMRREPQ
ncbi:MAG TPA: hypothetical protein VFU80_06550 [Sphingomicrobium sp.]|nr:hypothetical protein [Sphingomicrobium sp.]